MEFECYNNELAFQSEFTNLGVIHEISIIIINKRLCTSWPFWPYHPNLRTDLRNSDLDLHLIFSEDFLYFISSLLISCIKL